ncbi:MAG: hypothetical protein HYZ92_03290 [Candidatus Omnitrophica bacterium]|nr:hypothetical protein [Candidatus Omnitrophota bacterium]
MNSRWARVAVVVVIWLPFNHLWQYFISEGEVKYLNNQEEIRRVPDVVVDHPDIDAEFAGQLRRVSVANVNLGVPKDFNQSRRETEGWLFSSGQQHILVVVDPPGTFFPWLLWRIGKEPKRLYKFAREAMYAKPEGIVWRPRSVAVYMKFKALFMNYLKRLDELAEFHGDAASGFVFFGKKRASGYEQGYPVVQGELFKDDNTHVSVVFFGFDESPLSRQQIYTILSTVR